MIREGIINLFRSCFSLLIPVLIWNLLLYDSLPEFYQDPIFNESIPELILIAENVLRAVIFVLPVFLHLSLKTPVQKRGLYIYFFGIIFYFLSWLTLIIWPESVWSKSMIGILAPAYTIVFWLIAIPMIGKNYLPGFEPVRWIYFISVLLFTIVHVTHVYIVYNTIFST